MLPSSSNQVKIKETLHPLDNTRYQKILQKKQKLCEKFLNNETF